MSRLPISKPSRLRTGFAHTDTHWLQGMAWYGPLPARPGCGLLVESWVVRTDADRRSHA